MKSVIKAIEQMRVMKRFPSDASLASTSSTHSTSGWSNSGSTRLVGSGLPGHGTAGPTSTVGNHRLSMPALSHSSGVEFMETQ